MISLSLLAFTIVLAVWAWRRDKGSPLSVSLLMWVGITLIQTLQPLRLAPVTPQAAIIVGTGLLAMTIPVLRRWRGSEPRFVDQGQGRAAFAQLVIASAVTLAMVATGVYAFRSGVASATGSGFGQLTMQQVRAAQSGSARGGGLLGLLSAANPILACLGVYGALRYGRAWAALIVIGLLASLQTPARLTTLSLVVQVVVFYLYCRRVVPRRRDVAPRVLRRPPVLVMVGGLAVTLTLFSFIGERLGKTSLAASYFPEFRWPSWMLSVILYFTGGSSALSTALRDNTDPFDHPNSLFTLTRLFNLYDPTYKAPDTIGLFVPIPIPFNVYTGFGQIYFDFGLGGVVLLALILGWVAVSAHERAKMGYVEWAWVASVVAALLLSMPQGYRLFFLDVDFQLVAGFAAFWAIRRESKNSQMYLLDANAVGVGDAGPSGCAPSHTWNQRAHKP